MKPKEYIKKYGLDRYDGFGNKDSKNEFLADIANDFSTQVEYLSTVNQLNYERFKTCIKEIKQKWDGISNKMKGAGLSEGLWKYFFATVIVPMREDLFGEFLKKKEEAWKRKKQEREEFNRHYWGYAGGKSEFFSFFNIWKKLMGNLAFGTIPTTKFAALGISHDGATIESVNNAFREKIKVHHPDKGGSKEATMAIIEAKNSCIQYLQSTIKS